MASAAITITNNPATIESDSTEALITKDTALLQLEGELVNHGPQDVWCKASLTDTAAATVVTSGAQAQNQFPLPAGAKIDWLPNYKSIAHVTVAGSSTLSFRPRRRKE